MVEAQAKAGDKGTSLGLEENIEALIAYLVGWVSGLIIFLLETKSKYVRFHAAQSLVLFLGLMVVSLVAGFMPIIGWIISGLITLIWIIAWIICLIKAYQHEDFEIPIAGSLARKLVG